MVDLIEYGVLLGCVREGMGGAEESTGDFVQVKNPLTLKVNRLLATRVPVGVPGDYKPSIALLPDGELLLVMFYPRHLDSGEYQEDIILYRSADGGLTWSDREVLPLLGREPYLSVMRDGTILMTVHLLSQERRNKDGYVHSYVHRSTDAGHTWQTMRIGAEDVPGAPEKVWVLTSRNVLELADETVVLGVSAPYGVDFLWRSKDGGQTWDRSLACEFVGVEMDKVWCPFFAEAVFWESAAGKLLAIHRVDPRLFPALPGTKVPSYESDQVERMIVFRSEDGGRTWKDPTDLGDYGEMYPSVLRLQDGRLLLTFTVRALKPPLGVQAVLGYEDESGFRFNFKHDRIILDAKTPKDRDSGGGFGPTLQVADGTLVTAYSYRDANDQTHVEVVRWKLP